MEADHPELTGTGEKEITKPEMREEGRMPDQGKSDLMIASLGQFHSRKLPPPSPAPDLTHWTPTSRQRGKEPTDQSDRLGHPLVHRVRLERVKS